MPRPHRFAVLGAAALAIVLLGPSRGDLPSEPGAADKAAARPAVAAAAPLLSVYIHAHQDDWQLFMGDGVWESFHVYNRKLVWVYTTAGDADFTTRYWQTREAGARASMRVVLGPGTWDDCRWVTVNGNVVRRCARDNQPAVTWYMRLPDRNPCKDGLSSNCFLLTQLRESGTDIRALDSFDGGGAKYETWAEFTGTVRAIIQLEQDSVGALDADVAVHAPDSSRTLNPGDHSDHWATGDAVKRAVAGQGWKLYQYKDYDTKNDAVNLSSDQRDRKYRQFYSYDSTMVANGYSTRLSSAWPDYQKWLWRTYRRGP